MHRTFVFVLLLILAAACTQAPTAPPTIPESTTTPVPPAQAPTMTSTPPEATATPLPPTPAPPTLTPLPPTSTPTPEPTGDGVHWTKHPSNPVLDVGPESAWDDTLVGEPRVLWTENGYHMLFVGFDGTREGDGYSPFYGYGLGVATSQDGVAWGRADGNPVLSLAGQGFGMLWHGGVIVQGEYTTYYSIGDTLGGRTGLRIYRATSPDGLTWTPDERPVIDLGAPGSYDDYDAFAPSVLLEDGVYKMWYTASQENVGLTIAYATSTDGITWVKEASNPVLAEQGAYYPSVIKVGDTYMMWYSLPDREDDGHTAIYLATSPDGIIWTPHPDNPVLTHGQEGEWDGKSVLEPSVYFDGRVYHMWFTGASGPFQEKIGYATSP